jgi:hypothetical protein
MTNSLTDIGKIETFPMKKTRIGNWTVRDQPYGSRLKKQGQRDIYFKGELCMSAVIEHVLAMEFDFYGKVYANHPDSVNVILGSFGVDITVDRHNISYGEKWINIARTKDLVILRRVP